MSVAHDEVLGGQLTRLSIGPSVRTLVCDDAAARREELRSVPGPTRRCALLLPGLEDATFVERLHASLEVRALAVVAVRNSLLRDLAADRGDRADLQDSARKLSEAELEELVSSSARPCATSTRSRRLCARRFPSACSRSGRRTRSPSPRSPP